MKKLIAIGLVLLSSLNAVSAVVFKDEGISEGEVINLEETFTKTEVHADVSANTVWFNDVAGSTNGFDGIVDYRVEAHTPLYRVGASKGHLVTRIEGFTYFDGSEAFFDDRSIDIPEIFWQNRHKTEGGTEVDFALGRIANRRFFDKDELAPDPFDIGERPFFGAIANTNNVFNRINTARDTDHRNSIQQTGDFGIYTSIKDTDGKGLFNRWGHKQGFFVSDIEHNFGKTFYLTQELNKDWGEKYPGRFTAGLLLANEDVFRQPTNGERSYLTYASLVQKIHPKVTHYFRYGLLSTSDATGNGFVTNHITSGFLTKLTKKDILANHIVWFSDRNLSSRLLNLNFWIHKFNKNFYSTAYATFRYGLPNSANAFSGQDNSFFFGLNLTATI